MIFKIFDFLKKIEQQINGNPEVSICVIKEKYIFRTVWFHEDLKYRFEYQFSFTDLLQEEEEFVIANLVQRINAEYRNKMEEQRGK